MLLDPYAYELAYQRGLVHAAYAVLKEGEGKYGAQFLASRRGGFTSYFDEGTGLTVLVEVAGARLIPGKLQFARIRAKIGTIRIKDRIILRFTFCDEIIILG